MDTGVREKSDDERRDDVLRQMLKTPPTSNRSLKLGKPRNPRQRPKDKCESPKKATKPSL